MQGDCLERMKEIPDSSVDLIVTSPPYADRRKSTYGGLNQSMYNEWFIPIVKEMKRVLKDSGSIFINIKPHCEDGERVLYVYKLVIDIKEIVGLRFVDEFAWTKNGVPGKFKGRFKNAFEPVYHFSKSPDFTFNPYSVATKAKEVSLSRYKRKACGTSNNGSGFGGMRKEIKSDMALPSNHIHFTQKSNQHTIQSKHPAVYPVELVTFFINAFSNEGDTVLDPFMGSGTTAAVAIKNNRKFLGCELNTDYKELQDKRIADARKENEKKTLF
jgi:site-specific DNA-methyltransferase (adenine-specific)/site-specific DNA-methyltransferase (cytosine-N4-specific)